MVPYENLCALPSDEVWLRHWFHGLLVINFSFSIVTVWWMYVSWDDETMLFGSWCEVKNQKFWVIENQHCFISAKHSGHQVVLKTKQ